MLKLEKRQRPDKILGFRCTASEEADLRGYAERHGAMISDVILSALKQTGVIGTSSNQVAR